MTQDSIALRLLQLPDLKMEVAMEEGATLATTVLKGQVLKFPAQQESTVRTTKWQLLKETVRQVTSAVASQLLLRPLEQVETFALKCTTALKVLPTKSSATLESTFLTRELQLQASA